MSEINETEVIGINPDTQQTLLYLTEQADRQNRACLDVALIKAAVKINPGINLGTGPDEWDKIEEATQGLIKGEDMFPTLERFELTYGICVRRVVSTANNLQRIEIPEKFKERVDLSGYANPEGVNIRMFHKVVGGKTFGHAEVDDGTDFTRERIKQLGKEGWIATVLVELEEPKKSSK